MQPRTPRYSRFGLWIAVGGGAIVAFCIAILARLRVAPGVFAGQEWLAILPYLAVAALGITLFGLRHWAQFRAAEKIADLSERLEAKGTHPLMTLLGAAVFGGGVIYLGLREHVANFLTNIKDNPSEGAYLMAMTMSAPVAVFLLDTGIMAYHRGRRPRDMADVKRLKAREQRQTSYLMYATPLLILVPYALWVALQPGVEPYVPARLRD